MNNINNEKENINDSEYKYDQPKEDINTIYYEVKSKDDINIFEGVLINLEEYLKKKSSGRSPNYFISNNKIEGFLDEDINSKIIIEHDKKKNEFGIEIVNCSEIQIPSWYLNQIYYIDNKEKFLKWMPLMVRNNLKYDDINKERLNKLIKKAEYSEKYYTDEIKTFPYLVANAYSNPGPMRKELKKDFIPIINTINKLLSII